MPGRRLSGLALIIVVGILGVLAVLAVSFVLMAQLERRASAQRVNAARAYLLARSGIEDALARLALGQDASYGGEDWRLDGDQGPGSFDRQQEVYHPGVLDVESCPARHALRPSFFVGDGFVPPRPALMTVDGRQRGYSGLLAGDHATRGNAYALKVESGNAGIHVNGGALDDLDRDPDGPGGPPETAPLLPDTVPDHRDVSMEGPNGFLVRLLNNLDAVVTDNATPDLGLQVVGARPIGGYRSLEELKPVLGAARYDLFRPYLTVAAWVDSTVVKPQPMDGRPQRWEDIDDAHRTGTEAAEISGVHEDPAEVAFTYLAKEVRGPLITLTSVIAGTGVPGDPWVQGITATNFPEGTRTCSVSWERGYVYAWGQLRASPPVPEPRAPLSLNSSPAELLASALMGLKGTWLEAWDGSAGWDAGFGWACLPAGLAPDQPWGTYAYPDQATEETPWHRTRVDYGMTYGTEGRPWYGPATYDPHAMPARTVVDRSGASGTGGKPWVQAAPLGRLRETLLLEQAQALSVAREVILRIREAGAFRTWQQFNVFVAGLPRWEDLDDDGNLDGLPYPVVGDGGAYVRKLYRREDLDSDGRMARESFPRVAGSWTLGAPAWLDPAQDRAGLAGLGRVPGLDFVQKDLIRAMANPNTDLNDFNPDANLFKEADKTDLAGIPSVPGSYAHTTEFSLETAAGLVRLHAEGRVTSLGGRLLARRGLGALVRSGAIRRDTTQADFMRAYAREGHPLDGIFTGSFPPYPMAGGQALVSYPEPQTLAGGARAADADYDGQVSLGFAGALQGTTKEVLRGDLFDAADATATTDAADPDLRGPVRERLLRPAGEAVGHVFPDGVYSEKDRSLRFPLPGGNEVGGTFYVSCWAKPNWLPEASPRAHALVSLSCGKDPTPWTPWGTWPSPLSDLWSVPMGLYFVPARNNAWQGAMGTYEHAFTSTRGRGWPSRCLLWGGPHSLFASDCLNVRGMIPSRPDRPVGRLEGRRWQHLAAIAMGSDANTSFLSTSLLLGKRRSSLHGGGWNRRLRPIEPYHKDGMPNHLRFGEVAGFNNMNYTADATFACVSLGHDVVAALAFYTGASGPGALGRYVKEDGAAYAAPPLPAGARPLTLTWTEIPCDLWSDEDADGWLGSPLGLYRPQNDRFGWSPGGLPADLPNGLRDVRIALEAWDDGGLLARFDDPAADNRIPRPRGRFHYKAVFVNEWDALTRANMPLDVTPFLDDVTVHYLEGGGPAILRWEAGGQE